MARYAQYDFSPGTVKEDPKEVPHGFDYWPGEKVKEKEEALKKDLKAEEEKLKAEIEEFEKKKAASEEVKEDVKNVSCETCGWTGKNETVLKAHKTRFHKG